MDTPLLNNILIDRFSYPPERRLFYQGSWYTYSYDQGIVPYAYRSVETSRSAYWILVSAGPNIYYDFDPEIFIRLEIPERFDYLCLHTYDPTNGTTSHGDEYDPTNGAISHGDIFRFGGNWKTAEPVRD